MTTTRTTKTNTNLNQAAATKAELEKILKSYELSELDKAVAQRWGGKTWMPQGLRDAASDYVKASKQTPSLLLWAVYVLDQYGMFRDISKKGKEDFLKDFE